MPAPTGATSSSQGQGNAAAIGQGRRNFPGRVVSVTITAVKLAIKFRLYPNDSVDKREVKNINFPLVPEVQAQVLKLSLGDRVSVRFEEDSFEPVFAEFLEKTDADIAIEEVDVSHQEADFDMRRMFLGEVQNIVCEGTVQILLDEGYLPHLVTMTSGFEPLTGVWEKLNYGFRLKGRLDCPPDWEPFGPNGRKHPWQISSLRCVQVGEERERVYNIWKSNLMGRVPFDPDPFSDALMAQVRRQALSGQGPLIITEEEWEAQQASHQ
ncbi:hypothetical protein MMC21_006640 [Puttea exsequens]|nr:hypothetical protein [Puttea exsequens]